MTRADDLFIFFLGNKCYFHVKEIYNHVHFEMWQTKEKSGILFRKSLLVSDEPLWLQKPPYAKEAKHQMYFFTLLPVIASSQQLPKGPEFYLCGGFCAIGTN